MLVIFAIDYPIMMDGPNARKRRKDKIKSVIVNKPVHESTVLRSILLWLCVLLDFLYLNVVASKTTTFCSAIGNGLSGKTIIIGQCVCVSGDDGDGGWLLKNAHFNFIVLKILFHILPLRFFSVFSEPELKRLKKDC